MFLDGLMLRFVTIKGCISFTVIKRKTIIRKANICEQPHFQELTMPNLKQSLQAMMLSGLGLSLALPVYAVTAEQNTQVGASIAGVNASAQVNTSADTGVIGQGVQSIGQGLKNIAVKTGDVVSSTATTVVDGSKDAAGYVGDKAQAGWDKTKETTVAAKDATLDAGATVTSKTVVGAQNVGSAVADKSKAAAEFGLEKAAAAKDATVNAGTTVATKTVTGVEHAGDVVADKSKAAAEFGLETAASAKETTGDVAHKAATTTKTVAQKTTAKTKAAARKAAEKAKAAKKRVSNTLTKTAGSAQVNHQTTVNGQVGSHSAHLDTKTAIKAN